jgi:hypothetical protein
MSYLPSFAVVSKVTDKWLGKKLVMPDNTIGYFPCDTENEAHYICAIMNSTNVRKYFERRSSKSKWGISINMVESIPIARFNPSDKNHVELATLSKMAHLTELPEEIENVEARIDKLLERL